MSNFTKEFFYKGWVSIQHREACILCKTFSSQHGFCAGCRNDLAVPTRPCCPRCGLTVPIPGQCGRCLKKPFAFDAVYTAYTYAYPLTHLVHAFKYQKQPALAKPLAQLMLAVIPPKTDVLLPMPLHINRLKQRGFNQAQRLSRYLAQHTRTPVLTTAAMRTRDTPKQSQLNEKARHRNLRQAFYIQPHQVAGLSITLIDDVLTSGASLHALAKALKHAGASSVICWVLARTQAHYAD